MNYPNVIRIAAENAEILKGKHSPYRDDRDYAVYASELLPSLFGGQWIKSAGSNTRIVGGEISHFLPFRLGGLFDHLVFFRPKGSRGALSLDSTVAIGQPYGTKDGTVDDEDNQTAAGLVAQGVGVWASRELSTWYPGWTILIVAARGLLGLNASDFGFTALPAERIVR